MLEVRGLSCGYGNIQVVHGIDFHVPRGSITALLGPNGAGKTTTMLAIAGLVHSSSGRIELDGTDISGAQPAQRVRQGVAISPEGRRIFADLTVAENLLIGGYSLGKEDAQRGEQEVLRLFPRLAQRYRQRAGTMSGGEQQMLAIGRALMAKPRLLLVDELSLGLMPAMIDIIFDALRQLRQQGLTTLLVEQNTQRALSDADHVVVMTAGRVAFDGTAEQARMRPDFAELFLGEMVPH